MKPSSIIFSQIVSSCENKFSLERQQGTRKRGLIGFVINFDEELN